MSISSVIPLTKGGIKTHFWVEPGGLWLSILATSGKTRWTFASHLPQLTLVPALPSGSGRSPSSQERLPAERFGQTYAQQRKVRHQFEGIFPFSKS